MPRLRPFLAWTAALGGLALLLLFADMWKALGAASKDGRLLKNQASPQWDGRAFSNHLPEHVQPWKALWRFFLPRPEAVPQPDAIPVEAVEPSRFAQAPASGLRITWFGHSSFYLEIDGVRLLVDPVWGPRTSPSRFFGPGRFHAMPISLEALPLPDAVLFSHDHYDHLDLPTIQAIKHWKTRFITPLGMGAHLEAWGVPPERITEKDWWQEEALAGLTLACLPARHFSGRHVLDRNQTLWSGWAVIGPKHRFYYSGDTAYFDGFKAIGAKYGPFDASCIESGAYNPAWPDVHVGPEQAVQACVDARGGLMLPVHWASFRLSSHGWTEPVERVLTAAKAAGLKVYVPQPGESVEPARLPAQRRWWPELPWQRAEEAPIRSSGFEAGFNR